MTPVAQSQSVEQALLQFYCVEFEFQDFCTIFFIFLLVQPIFTLELVLKEQKNTVFFFQTRKAQHKLDYARFVDSGASSGRWFKVTTCRPTKYKLKLQVGRLYQTTCHGLKSDPLTLSSIQLCQDSSNISKHLNHPQTKTKKTSYIIYEGRCDLHFNSHLWRLGNLWFISKVQKIGISCFMTSWIVSIQILFAFTCCAHTIHLTINLLRINYIHEGAKSDSNF